MSTDMTISISADTAAACAIVRGEVPADPGAVGCCIQGAWRELSARGRGGEWYRRRLDPKTGVWTWVTEERLPRVSARASDRRSSVTGPVYGGDLVATYARDVSPGRVSAVALTDVHMAVETSTAPLRVCVWRHRRDGQIEVTLPDGTGVTVSSPDWR